MIRKNHEYEKISLEAELQKLQDEQKQMNQEIPKQREKAEENAWQDIDNMEDKNKALLLSEIERGVEKAAELTKEKTKLIES